MDQSVLDSAISQQREFFRSGATVSLDFRKTQLTRLREILEKHEGEIFKALKADLNKPQFEAYVGELGFVFEEIRHVLKNLKLWMKPKKVRTSLVHAIGSSWIYPEPRGQVLVISPWNYPLQLVMSPLVGLLAAGNTAVIKPSELAPETSNLVTKMINKGMDPRVAVCIEGDAEVSQALLSRRFDYIFFTGGVEAGKIVMKAASKYLTPVTLELGGKSPCIVDVRTDMDTTARRIAWGKFFNAGQSCVAPDYVLVDGRVKKQFLDHLEKAVTVFFGTDPFKSPNYGRIINKRHFERLTTLLNSGGRVVLGGKAQAERLYFSPTVVTDLEPESKIMEEEIFGPILPVLGYSHLTDALSFVNERPRPLALYVFSTDRQVQKRVIRETSFGGGCINDTLVHFSNLNLPFGGVGDSGMGACHGHFSFKTFSHMKSVMKRSFLFDPGIRYSPYREHLKIMRKLIG